MPADYEIHADRGLVWSRAWSRLEDADLLGHQERLRADRAFQPTYHQLFDFRPVTSVALSREAARRFARSNPFGPGSRRVFLASRPAMYGVARMIQMWMDDLPPTVRVERDDPEEAWRWLGLEEPGTT